MQVIVPGPYSFKNNLCKKESEEVHMLILTYFDNFGLYI